MCRRTVLFRSAVFLAFLLVACGGDDDPIEEAHAHDTRGEDLPDTRAETDPTDAVQPQPEADATEDVGDERDTLAPGGNDVAEDTTDAADASTEPERPTWSTIRPLLNCAGCHSATFGFNSDPPEELLSFSTQVPEMRFIEPFDVDRSYIWHKINDTHQIVGGQGSPMPLQGGRLSQDVLDQIEAWIEQGAAPLDSL